MTTTQKLDDGRMTDHLMGWFVTLSITIMAFGLRLWHLSYPKKLIFDETYYAKDAYSLLKFGYEGSWPERNTADVQIAAGTPDLVQSDPAFIVHPPLGKWLIALGEYTFGMNPFGWRIMSVIFGSLLIFVTIRFARRLSRSTLIGGIAGILVTFDGLAFVMSRVSLLDIFQATFTLSAVACLLTDRDYFRHRLADYLRHTDQLDLGGTFGPLIAWRPWRILAGIMFGAACAVKWNSIYALAVFGLVAVFWDISARRLAGASKAAYKSLFIDAPLAFVSLVILGAVTYLSTWFSWFFTAGGYDRQWGTDHPNNSLVRLIGAPLASLWKYHTDMYQFHTHGILSSTHPYASHPATWPLMIRPLSMDAVNNIPASTPGCNAGSASSCIRVIVAMGTPALWWLAAVALLAGGYYWLVKRDWRFGIPVVGTLAIWLPWFQFSNRTIFFFYAVVMLPFLATGLALWLGKLLGPASARSRQSRAILVGVMLFLIIINFSFIYPVLTDELLTHTQWLHRMWFASWI